MISIKTHNILDYVIGGLFVLSPYLFGFSELRMARDVLVLLGAAVIAYSMITDYPLSIIKGLSLRVHMALDVVVGLFVMIAPSLYNYRAELTGFQYFLHVFYGLGFITVVSLSSRKPKGETISLESRRAA